MRFLLDTNAVSEPLRQRPDEGYRAWIMAQDDADLAASVLTLGELRRGARLLSEGVRRSGIDVWILEVMVQFRDRILSVDYAVAAAWAEVSVRHKRLGLVVGAIDELIAATALVHDLTLVTRNLRHFDHAGCKILCPWSA